MIGFVRLALIAQIMTLPGCTKSAAELEGSLASARLSGSQEDVCKLSRALASLRSDGIDQHEAMRAYARARKDCRVAD